MRVKKLDWRVKLGLGLVLLSAALYVVHWLIYRDPKHIFIYLLGDIAFIPIDVLLVTLVIHELLATRERRARLHKMNMAIGTFYSEVGAQLLGALGRMDRDNSGLREELAEAGKWTDEQFKAAHAHVRGYQAQVASTPEALAGLRSYLLGKRQFLLGLLQNPNLLEHDAFTSLLWAVFHLTDELAHRRDVRALSEADRAHLEGDIKRAYGLLVAQWVDYMRHLKASYPYLFSLAARTNPFDPAATPEVK